MTGADIKVSIFDSRVEIISPGGFPKGITVEEVVGGRSEIRNKVIVRIFKEAKKIEQWGRVVKRTIQLCINKGLKKPEISEVGMFVKFVFYRESDAKSDAKSDTRSDAKSGAKSDAKNNISSYYDLIANYLIYTQESLGENNDNWLLNNILYSTVGVCRRHILNLCIDLRELQGN